MTAYKNSSGKQRTAKASRRRLYRDVEFLTELRPFRNYRNTQSLEKVCDYLREEFYKAGLETEDQSWLATNKQYTNIIASYNKAKRKRLILGAHYDVAGDQPGADDNASAVAGLLETARMLAENKPKLDYRIDFVGYCLEEPPFFHTDLMGSYVHARSLYKNRVDVIGMICYEMIGYFSKKQYFPSAELAEIYPSKGDFIIVVGTGKYEAFNLKVHQLIKRDSGIPVEKITFSAPDDPYAGMSDHWSYWQHNYPALMINDTSMFRNPHYHLASDSIETLDFEKMTEVVNSSYRAVTGF